MNWNWIEERSTLLLFYFITVSVLSSIYIVYFIKCNKKISLHKKPSSGRISNYDNFEMKELVSNGILDTYVNKREDINP